MPARKNRPDKHKMSSTDREAELARKLLKEDRKQQTYNHLWVGWPDMDIAKGMEKKGLLRESLTSLGSFYLTDLFYAKYGR